MQKRLQVHLHRLLVVDLFWQYFYKIMIDIEWKQRLYIYNLTVNTIQEVPEQLAQLILMLNHRN
jgi:hypothetical protein